MVKRIPMTWCGLVTTKCEQGLTAVGCTPSSVIHGGDTHMPFLFVSISLSDNHHPPSVKNPHAHTQNGNQKRGEIRPDASTREDGI